MTAAFEILNRFEQIHADNEAHWGDLFKKHFRSELDEALRPLAESQRDLAAALNNLATAIQSLPRYEPPLDLLTAHEAAKVLRVHTKTVYRLAQNGLKGRRVGAKLVFARDDLLAYQGYKREVL